MDARALAWAGGMLDGAAHLSLDRNQKGFSTRFWICGEPSVLNSWAQITQVPYHQGSKRVTVRAKDQARVLKMLEPYSVRWQVPVMIQARRLLYLRGSKEKRAIVDLWKEVRRGVKKTG